METVRAFVAVPLPESHQQKLARLRRELSSLAPSRLRWTKPGAWHLTLKFLGDVPAEGPGGVDELVRALRTIVFFPFPFKAAGGGFFPNASRPRVVWVGVGRGDAACRRLAAAVEETLAPLGCAPQKRPFAPHLTVARTRGSGGRNGAAGLLDVQKRLQAEDWPEWEVDRVVLFKSDLRPSGAEHTPLGEVSAVRDGGETGEPGADRKPAPGGARPVRGSRPGCI